jgi:hypothetical protein
MLDKIDTTAPGWAIPRSDGAVGRPLSPDPGRRYVNGRETEIEEST